MKTRQQELADKYYTLVDDMKRLDQRKELKKKEIFEVLREMKLISKQTTGG